MQFGLENVPTTSQRRVNGLLASFKLQSSIFYVEDS